MTLLAACQAASDEIGIIRPSSIVSNTAPESQKLLRYANKVGSSLAKKFAWQRLRKEQTFTAISGETQTGILPDDFDRFVPETFWDRTNTALLIGPISSVEWATRKAENYTGQKRFILRGNDIAFVPSFGGGESLAFEYVSNQWVLANDGTTYKAAFTADTDTSLIDEELLTYGIKAAYLEGEGLPAAAAMMEFDKLFNQLTGNDQPSAGILAVADIFSSGSRHFSGAPGSGWSGL